MKSARSEAEKKAIAALTKPQPDFSAWRAARKLNAKPGAMIGKQGVFIGAWEPRDRDNKSLGKIFNVFAAPEDLTDAAGRHAVLTYEATQKRIGALKSWHGFDGSAYENDSALFEALREGSYDGGWIMPTSELVSGEDIDRNLGVQKDNISMHRDQGALKDTLVMSPSKGKSSPDWYWSCTEDRWRDRYLIEQFWKYARATSIKGHDDRYSCRPVRLVEVRDPS